MIRKAVRFLLPLILLGMAFLVVPVSSSASDIPTAITSIKIDESSAGRWSGVTVDMAFSLPAGSQPGDTFIAVLPTSLIAQDQTFSILAPDGSLVATVVILDGTATFTLSNYVLTHEDVVGVAKARAHFDQNQITPGQDNDFDFHAGTTHWHSTVDIGAPISADHTKAYKIGYWTDGEDQGGHGLAGAVSWRVYSKAGPWNTLVFHDTLGAGQVNDCTSINVVSATTYNPDGSLIDPLALGSRATVTCTANSFRVSIGTVNPAEVVRVSYTTTITDASQTPFSNAVDVISNGITVPKSWAISHYSAFGSAVGVVPPTTATTPRTTPATATTPETRTTVKTTATATRTSATTTPVVLLGTQAAPPLAATGSHTAGLLEAGGLLLLLGSGLLRLGRRRRGVHEN